MIRGHIEARKSGRGARVPAASWTLLAALLLAPAGVRAQQLLDWTVRSSAAPEALVRGAGAVFWNPANIAPVGARAEAFVLDLEGPSTTGLGGLALAGAGRLRAGTVVGAGYQHLAIDGIPVTAESPMTQPETEIVVAEDRFTLSGAQPVGATTSAGAIIQYERSSNGTETGGHLTFGAGASYRGGARLRPGVAAAVFIGSETRWTAAAEITPPLSAPIAVQLAYGISGGERQGTPTHRAALTARWQERLAATLALLAEPGSGGSTVQPVLGAELQLGRYLLGVLREGLPHGFGATYSYRLNVRL